MIDKYHDCCSGCEACKYICPVNAIEMEADSEGFLYPQICRERCIQCNFCEQYCPQKDKMNSVEYEQKFFAGRNRDMDVVEQSSSGGIFDAIARSVLDRNGIVYGVGIDDQFVVRYFRVCNYRQIGRLRGSKYVTAHMDQATMECLLDDIKKGEKVLFVGTACKVAGVIGICKARHIDMSNAIFCDFFQCSGNASPLLWREEVNRLSANRQISDIYFRDKSNGWRNYSFKINYVDKTSFVADFLLSVWGRLFGLSYSSRENCMKCQFNGFHKKSDISIGDFWNSYAIPKIWKDNKGVSLVVVNTEKGQEAIESIEGYALLQHIEKNSVNWEKESREADSKRRSEFWSFYRQSGYENLLRKYCAITWKDKFLTLVVRNSLIKTKMIELLDKRK